jgi:hypothetical protein
MAPMKKVMFLLIGCLTSATVLAADIKVSTGLEAGVSIDNFQAQPSYYAYNISWNNFQASAFLDLTYLLLKVGYDSEIGQTSQKEGSWTGILDDKYQLLLISLAAKLPVKLSDFFGLFLTVGIDNVYDINQIASPAYTPTQYLTVGAGADIYISKTAYIRPNASYGYKIAGAIISLTNQNYSPYSYAAVGYLGGKIDIGLAFGFGL